MNFMIIKEEQGNCDYIMGSPLHKSRESDIYNVYVHLYKPETFDREKSNVEWAINRIGNGQNSTTIHYFESETDYRTKSNERKSKLVVKVTDHSGIRWTYVKDALDKGSEYHILDIGGNNKDEIDNNLVNRKDFELKITNYKEISSKEEAITYCQSFIPDSKSQNENKVNKFAAPRYITLTERLANNPILNQNHITLTKQISYKGLV